MQEMTNKETVIFLDLRKKICSIFSEPKGQS